VVAGEGKLVDKDKVQVGDRTLTGRNIVLATARTRARSPACRSVAG
jgi:pyruvate/2-oxoglutarate dehydrogenase complex dihydrolipoamide dehydrogenase (E3) component